MNEKSIQAALMKDLYPKGVKIMCPNYWLGYGECDLIGINPSNLVVEYEIKCSRSDFKADRKKVRKHKAYMYNHSKMPYKHGTWGVPNRFYYVCPEGLLKPEDIFDYSGLIYISPTYNVSTIVKAPLIHSNKFADKLHAKLANALTIKLVYGKLGSKYDPIENGLKVTNNPSNNEAKNFFENLK